MIRLISVSDDTRHVPDFSKFGGQLMVVYLESFGQRGGIWSFLSPVCGSLISYYEKVRFKSACEGCAPLLQIEIQ